MKKYSIVYCFVDKKGYVEVSNGYEVFYNAEVIASDTQQAILKLKKDEKFKSPIEVIDIKEINL